MRRYAFGLILIGGIVYALHHFENENSLKPTLQKSIAKAYESTHSTPSDVKLLESNIPLKFLIAIPGDVVSLVRINGKTIKITHHVEFFGVTPIVSLIADGGMFQVRISEESHERILKLEK